MPRGTQKGSRGTQKGSRGSPGGPKRGPGDAPGGHGGGKAAGNWIYLSEGFALTGYDIPGCVEGGAWMLWGNSSVAAAVVAAADALPDLENGHFSSFITKSALPECADRSVSSSGCRRLY